MLLATDYYTLIRILYYGGIFIMKNFMKNLTRSMSQYGEMLGRIGG